jgi:hypothetical protein
MGHAALIKVHRQSAYPLISDPKAQASIFDEAKNHDRGLDVSGANSQYVQHPNRMGARPGVPIASGLVMMAALGDSLLRVIVISNGDMVIVMVLSLFTGCCSFRSPSMILHVPPSPR